MQRIISTWAVVVCLLTSGHLFGPQAAAARDRSDVGTPAVQAASDPPAGERLQIGGQRPPLQQAAVPRLIRFNGLLRDLAGKPLTGPVDVTFTLYGEEAGGAPLWFETQTVQADALGGYTVLLGAMTPAGIPMELFTQGEAHWLGVMVQGLPEQPRVLLVSVPYALKSGDAETLGGKPASAYALISTTGSASTTNSTISGLVQASALTTRTGSPTPLTLTATQNYIPVMTANDGSLGNSVMYQSGGFIGVGTTAPAFPFDLNNNVFAIGPKSSRPGAGGTMRFRDDTGTVRWLFGVPGTAGSQDFFMYNYANGHAPLYIQNGAASYMLYIDSSGDLGVGTNAPAYTLHVNGNTIGVGTGSYKGGGGTVRFRDDTGAERWAMGIPGSTGATDFFMLNSANGHQPLYIQANAPTNALYLNASGNVGIGTAAPAHVLDVAGDIHASTNLAADGNLSVTGTISGNGSGLTVLNAGNLSSGTLPSARLAGTYSGAVTFNNASNVFTGNGAGLTNLAAANVTGSVASAATATTASGLSCVGCIGDSQLGVNYAGSSSKGGAAANALMLGGSPPSAFQPAGSYATLGSNAFSGDQTIGGNLTLNGLVNGWQIVPYTSQPCTALGISTTCTSSNVLGGYTIGKLALASSVFLGKSLTSPVTGANIITANVVGGTISGGGGTVGDYDYHNWVDNNFATVSGGGGNQAGDGKGPDSTKCCETVAGGISNVASGSEATVGGGDQNYAEARADTVAGGYCNDAYGGYSFVGGGYCNFAAGGYSTIGGGSSNNTANQFSTVAGGGYNNAKGVGSTVGGGYLNNATGNYSFAAGCNAYADTNGSFVWTTSITGASQNCITVKASLTNSGAAGQFIALAPGGVTFYSNTALNAGVSLAAGSGSWSSVSDRNAKQGFVAVDGADLLAKLDRIPISTWSYKSQQLSIRHMGPMAQDLRAAFHLGEDDKHIDDIDGQGVALAGVQALYRMSLEKDQEIRALKSENRELARKLAELTKAQQEMAAAVNRLAAKVVAGRRDEPSAASKPRLSRQPVGAEVARVKF